MKRNKYDIDIYKHLAPEELLDYNQGILGSSEMYRLELHLNECSLCSDALEGMADVKNPKEVLSAINKEINPIEETTISITYWTIAASITLLALVGISYWFLSKPVNEPTLAINTPPLEILEEKPILDKTPAIIDSAEDILTEEPPVQTEETERTTVAVEHEKPKQQPIISRQEIEHPEATEDIISVEQVSGAVNNVAAIEEAMIKPIESDAEILAEVVEANPTNASKARKKESKAQSIPMKDQNEPIPTGGMPALKAYINQNLIYPQKAVDNKIKGTVILEVTINSDGSINNISVIKGIGFGCDAEAMRLISTGPSWTPKVENGTGVKASRQLKIKFKK